jgi:hypothetical protein
MNYGGKKNYILTKCFYGWRKIIFEGNSTLILNIKKILKFFMYIDFIYMCIYIEKKAHFLAGRSSDSVRVRKLLDLLSLMIILTLLVLIYYFVYHQ